MRVAVVNWRDLDHSLAGGSEIYAWEFARALRESGAEVEFLTAREPGMPRVGERDGIVVRRAGGQLGFYPATLLRLLRRRRRLDLVIDPSCGLPSFSPLVLRRRTPVVLVLHHVHQAQFATHFPAPAAAFGRWLERVAMRVIYRRRHVVAVSPSTAEEMRHQLGWTGEIGLLPNGAALPAAVSAGDKDPGRVAVLGRLVAHKRVDLVLRAFAAQGPLTAGGVPLHLDVIGQGPEREHLERLAGELGVADRVTFHGFVDEETKGRLLARAALHVCGSDAEGWGQAVIDAAGHGVPTLARDVPGLRDSIRAGHSGWLVPDTPGDHDLVAQRLTAALTGALTAVGDDAHRTVLLAECRSWAAEFDWSRMRAQAARLAEGLVRGRVVDAPTTPCFPSEPRDPRVAV